MNETAISTLPEGDEQRLLDLLQDCLNLAREQGATACEARVAESRGLSIDVRLGEVETLEHNNDKGLSLTVWQGQQKGSAHSSDFSAAGVRQAVEAALSIARYSEADECSGLAEADALASEVPDLDLYHPWAIDAQQAIALAQECEQAARDVDQRISNSDGASVHTAASRVAYANSNGFAGGWRSTRHGLSCTMLAEDEAGKQRDYWYSTARVPEQLEAAAAVGRRAGERTLRRLGARKPKTCSVPVLFENRIAASLFSHFISAISGSSLFRKSSFLLDKIDTEVFSPLVNAQELPHLLRGPGSAPFDSDGLATRDKLLVEDGVLRSYLLSTYSARKLKLQSTANAGGVHNLVVAPGERSPVELMADMGTGLLVTELMGFGINGVTGDYSRGASGYWVENGEIQYPVEEATIAGNLRDMYRDIVAIGNDVDPRGNIQCGSVLIGKMTVAGK